ncbi:MAG: Fic family protein [Betaproteobacteria bacterium]|nr:Fic family protein [Betaproteobacteria bacterium]
MPKPHEKLASALEALKGLQNGGLQAIPGPKLSRADREALLRAGFLKEVIRGWYIPRRPDVADGDTTASYASMREFIADYAQERFGGRWHVNPEQSVLLRSGERTIPKQVQIWATEGANQTVQLLHGCSLFIYKAAKLLPSSPVQDCGGLRLVELPAALVAASPTLYLQHAMAAQIALGSLPDASDLLRILLDGPHPSVAGRLAGGFRAIGRVALADEIVGAMRSAGHGVNEVNPFEKPLPTLLPGGRAESPYVQRLRLMWAEMRESVIAAFPQAPGAPKDIDALLKDVEARYVTDAYHSLSIEGYRVTATLIEKVRDGNWNADGDEKDRATRDAMAARGYFETHNLVKEDLVRVMKGENPGTVFRQALPRWYQALFSPSVQAGIVKASDLAGYRNDQVFIRAALHVPLSKEAVRDCMPVLFELLEAETEPQARAVLGHFLFVYIHPYMDGNGRLARFLMNLMLVPAGYVWTVIPVERRPEYMNALEQASSFANIAPLATFIADLAKAQAKEPLRRPLQ